MKIKIGNIVRDEFRPKPENGKHVLFAAKPCIIYPEQVTEVNIGCDITIPEGYMGLLTPYSTPVLDERCILVEGGGIVLGTFRTVKMRKGINGDLKVHVKDPIAYLYVVPREELEFVYY